MKHVNIENLLLIIEAALPSAEIQMLYKDAFATGCYLHRSGNKQAGRKLCCTVLDALGFDEQKNYFSDILDTLDGNENAYASAVQAHSEINSLRP